MRKPRVSLHLENLFSVTLGVGRRGQDPLITIEDLVFALCHCFQRRRIQNVMAKIRSRFQILDKQPGVQGHALGGFALA